MYDDGTDNVSNSHPTTLQFMIQREANLSTAWIKDNKMVCSGAKTKLMVIGTKELRHSKLYGAKIEIDVDGCRVAETKSERLLGMILNNTMTWESHLYGNDENIGLVKKLSHRASCVSKLYTMMPRKRLKIIAEGIFFSVLNYKIEIYGIV